MTSRSTFIRTLAAGFLAAPLATFAQQPAKLHRIGVLANENNPPWEGFRRGLRDLGYVDGGNVTIEWRFSDGNVERFPALALELVRSDVDIIVASSTPAIRAAKQATTTIPIVMAVSAYPDKSGLVESLARPGGNVTGLTNVGPELMGKSFQVLKEVAPKVSRVAVLFNPGNPVEALALKDVQAAAAGVGVDIQATDVRTLGEYAMAFASIDSSRADALFAFGNPGNFKNRQLIADFALKRRLPSLYQERLFVESGGLVSYAPSYIEMYARAATFVDRILKGAKPADLPVEQPTKFELVINLKTAKALGLTIPQSLLLRADEVIQ
jgi:putative ABC transport system substrate-binding protein